MSYQHRIECERLRHALSSAQQRIAELEYDISQRDVIAENPGELFGGSLRNDGAFWYPESRVKQHIAAAVADAKALGCKAIKLPEFDGYRPHIVKELQAAFIQAVTKQGLTVEGE